MLKSVWKGRPTAPPAVPGPSVQNISDAYLYLLGRLFVLRQPWRASLATTAITVGLIYAIFVGWLSVPLPRGALGL